MEAKNEAVVKIEVLSAREIPEYKLGAVLAGRDERGRLVSIVCGIEDAAAACELLAAESGGAT